MKKYSIYLLSAIFTLLLLVAAFNWLINPYDIFNSPEITGLNSYKSEVERHTRLSKVYQLESLKPEVILLASSRGLVVPDEYLSPEGMRAYNLSLTSASTYEQFRMLQHAQSVNPLKRVVLALDEKITNSRQPAFVENRLAVNADGTRNNKKWKQTWQDYFSSLLSIDALRASSSTVRKQKDGPVNTGAEEYDRRRVYKAGGHHQMFRTMEASLFYQYKGDSSQCDTGSDKGAVSQAVAADVIKDIIEFSYENDIELIIYFSPAHARFYEAKCMVGEWAEIENTKRAVVATVEYLAGSYGVEPFPVWDFSGYNDVTTEQVPDIDDRNGRMRWYWEGSHYTQQTAQRIFYQIFTAESAFGVMLNADNIEPHLKDIRDKRDEYVASHGEDIAELALLFERSKSTRQARRTNK